MASFKTCLMSTVAVCFCSIILQAKESVIFVSPDGNDAWSGKLEQPNAARTDGPVGSIGKARDEAEKLKQGGAGEVVVKIAGGTYEIDKAIEFGAKDSGTAENAISYVVKKGEKAILCGAKRVGNWKPYKGKVMQAEMRDEEYQVANFGGVYYKGVRQHAARVPNFDANEPLYGGFAYTTEEVNEPRPVKIKYDPTVIRPGKWSEPNKAVADIFPGYNYGNRRVKVKGFDAEAKVLNVEGLDYRPVKGDRFFVENVFEELDAPGEWYFDAGKRVLYFWPPDDDLASEGVMVPVAESIIKITGGHDIQFKGMEFRFCRGSAISMQNAERCVVAGCAISDTGEHGVAILPASKDNKVISCEIMRTGQYGVYMTAPLFEHSKCSRNLVSNNVIYNMGTVLKEVGGVGILGAGENTVSHNVIHDGPRWGVFINSGAKNVIEYNHIYNMSLETEDTGAIYMGTAHGGWLPNLDKEKNKLHRGNVIRYNLIHDTVGYGMTGWWETTKGKWNRPYYAWSIYLDLGASGTQIYGNVCYNSPLGGLMFGTMDNIAENNIFAGGGTAQVCTIKWEPPTPKPEITVHFPSSGNRIERNIIMYSKPEAYLYWFVYQYGSKWEPNEFTFDKNIIWNGGKEFRIQGVSWKEWLGRGMDGNSIIADPMFVDAARHDYRLKEGSPAIKAGFKPIPFEKIGLYADEFRTKCKADAN